MCALIWATLLFFVRGSSADTGALVGTKTDCPVTGFCITLTEGVITAEAGLCVVIPCSFSTRFGFTPQTMVWFKCEHSKPKCSASDIIFHKNIYNVQSGFRGRVSLLEPDVSLTNCGIIVNDLTQSDSGLYQLRVNGQSYGSNDGLTFPMRATVSVKDLTQKPTLTIPSLTEGQQATLTCIAPGLCSGSVPEITWTWRGSGESDSHIAGNITAFMTESVTAVTQRHSSTLTFSTSAEHHGTEVTCRVSFANSITTEETATLNVTYVKELKITGNTRVKKGETLNLTCSVESFPPSLITWTKCSEKNMQNDTNLQNNASTNLQNNASTNLQNNTLEDNTLTNQEDDELTTLQDDTLTNLQNDPLTQMQNGSETYLQDVSGMGTLSISNVTVDASGRYICTAKYLNNTLMEKVDVSVIYMNEPVITGDTTVEMGRALNLTCSVKGFPPPRITWTVLGSNTDLQDGPNIDLQYSTGSTTLVIHNVTPEHSGQYMCSAHQLDTTVTTFSDVTVMLSPNILENSGCKAESEVLTCVCSGRGLPLPTIEWPLLKNHTEYSVTTTVSRHSVNSTVTLTVKDHSNAAVECVSSNEYGEARENLTIQSHKAETLVDQFKTISWLEVFISFLIGALLSALICCLVIKCHRKRQGSSGNLDQTLEMVTSQEDPLIDPDQTGDDDQTYYQEATEEGGDVATEKATLDPDIGPTDVEYASIDFSVLKKRSPREAAKKQDTTETEYAEIKKAPKEERQGNVREEGEVSEGKEEEPIIGDDEEKKHWSEEEDGEDVAVRSDVKDATGEI